MSDNVMEKEKESFQKMQKVSQSRFETYLAATQSAFDVYGRTLQCTRDIFMGGFETMKDHLNAAPCWFQTAHKSQDQQEATSSLMECAIEASKRNVVFMQNSFNQGIEALERNSETMRELAQKSIQKAQDQQELVWSRSA